MTKKLPIVEVPCNGCTLCCQRDAVRLQPEDAAENYLSEPHPHIPGALMIARKPNGECIYLNESGCGIHDRAPSLCRTVDCRTPAARIDFDMAMQLHCMGRLDFRVWDKGCKLLEAETAQGRKEKHR